MSGGHFDYKQYCLRDISDSIENIIKTNNLVEDDGWSWGFSKKTVSTLNYAVKIIKTAETYIQRIDWLLSGDDSEDSFHKRLEEELKEE